MTIISVPPVSSAPRAAFEAAIDLLEEGKYGGTLSAMDLEDTGIG
jgi:hypothetical protein